MVLGAGGGAGEDDVRVRIKLETQGAEEGLDKMDKKLQKTQSVLFKRLTAISAVAFGAFFGGVALEVGTGVGGLLNAIGRSTPAGRTAAEFAAGLRADESAAQRTATTFGFAGRNATEQQIQSVFDSFRRIEQLREQSRARVLGVVAGVRADEALGVVLNKLEIATTFWVDVGKDLVGVLNGFRLR